MRTSYLTVLIAIGLGLSGCARNQPARRDDSAAHEAGRDAYKAGETIKKGAKEAAHEIHEAGKDFREGWSEARKDDPKRRKQ